MKRPSSAQLLLFCLALLIACGPEAAPSTDQPGPEGVPLAATARPQSQIVTEPVPTRTQPALFDAEIVGEGCEAFASEETDGDHCADDEQSTEVPLAADKARVMGDALLLFQRTEALTGYTKEWRLFPDGRLDADDGSGRQVAVEEVEQTLTAIDGSGFFEMDSRYSQGEGCCPKYTYTLAVRDGDRFHQVNVALAGAVEAPPELMQILELVGDVVAGTE